MTSATTIRTDRSIVTSVPYWQQCFDEHSPVRVEERPVQLWGGQEKYPYVEVNYVCYGEKHEQAAKEALAKRPEGWSYPEYPDMAIYHVYFFASGKVMVTGDVPSSASLRMIRRWLDGEAAPTRG